MKNDKMRIYGNLEALVQQLEELDNWENLTRYEVTEHFGDKPERKFNFINLRAETFEIEGSKGILFIDAEQTIYNTYSVLLGVLEDSIQSAYFSVPKDGQLDIRIIFNDGYVDILAHCHYEIPVDEELERLMALDMDSPEVDKMYKEYYAQEDAYDL